ncbi:MAG: twin-arginine translocase TatA/TatE family subunit [Bdellovibrionaceae bacterium]|nr:twin-arginine translocase TatA/TatE family subunit [Pseudobdellovibrionaceae bacterium]
MFDIGFSEMVILGLIALVVIGPKQLPEVARMVARFINDVKRVTGELTGQIMAAKESANQFIHETQTNIVPNLDVKTNYQPETVLPPPHDGPLPEPEPSVMVGTHPQEPPVRKEPEQMQLQLDGLDQKGERGS